MRMTVCVVVALAAVAACSPKGANQSAATDSLTADTLTRRQKDSIFAHSKVPNAGAVGKAMNAADAEGAHNAAIDSANAEMSR